MSAATATAAKTAVKQQRKAEEDQEQQAKMANLASMSVAALKKKHELFAKQVKRQANQVLFELMPKKIVELTDTFAKIPGELAEQPVFVASGARANRAIYDLVQIVKREILVAVKYMDTLITFVRLQTPRIEDGDNFGVEVQDEILGMLAMGRQSALTVLNNNMRYFSSRGKLVSKVLKHPRVADYRRCVAELDTKQYAFLRLALQDIRNNIAVLYDSVTKNYVKLTQPKGRHDHRSIMF